MIRPLYFACLMALLLILPQYAAADLGARQQQGQVVAVIDFMLVMRDTRGGEVLRQVSPRVLVIINGTHAQLADLRRGDPIVVTSDDEGNVLAIACQRVRRSDRLSSGKTIFDEKPMLISNYASMD